MTSRTSDVNDMYTTDTSGDTCSIGSFLSSGYHRQLDDSSMGVGLSVTPEGLSVTSEGLSVTLEGLAVTSEGLSVTSEGLSVTLEGLAVTSEGLSVTSEGLSVTSDNWAPLQPLAGVSVTPDIFQKKTMTTPDIFEMSTPDITNDLCSPVLSVSHFNTEGSNSDISILEGSDTSRLMADADGSNLESSTSTPVMYLGSGLTTRCPGRENLLPLSSSPSNVSHVDSLYLENSHTVSNIELTKELSNIDLTKELSNIDLTKDQPSPPTPEHYRGPDVTPSYPGTNYTSSPPNAAMVLDSIISGRSRDKELPRGITHIKETPPARTEVRYITCACISWESFFRLSSY